MGTIHAVPKKLAPGMKVVVWIRPHIKLFCREFDAGIRVGKWFEATLLNYSNENREHVIEFQGFKIFIDGSMGYVIRSVATKDNKSDRHQETLQRARDKYRDKRQKLAALKAAQRGQ